MSSESPTKVCNICGEEKLIECFGFCDKKQSLSRRNACKKCLNKRYQTSKRAFGFRNKLLFYATIEDYLRDKSCERCGESRIGCLQFHHKNPDEKSFNIGGVSRRISMSLLIAEMKKCEVLCANCHAIEHYDKKKERSEGRGQWFQNLN